MKLILDFDDTIFNNTSQFKPRIFSCLERAGVPRDVAEDYYREVREREFSLKDFLVTLLSRFNIEGTSVESLYQEIMRECPNFVNKTLMKVVQNVGRENCIIVSNGEEKFQQDKIKMSGVGSFFSEIFVVSETKKDVIGEICERNRNQEILFIEDKQKFIEDLPFDRYKNLKAVLYNENELQKLLKQFGVV